MSSVFKYNFNENRILNNFSVTEEAVVEILESLDLSKSCGPDNLPAVVLKGQLQKNCAKELTKSIFELLRKFRRLGTYPSAWKIGTVSSIFKKRIKSRCGKLSSCNTIMHCLKRKFFVWLNCQFLKFITDS